MNYNEFFDEEFRRVDEILSNTQTALDRMHRLDQRSASDIIREMKYIRNAMSNLEMSFRAERDKIREKEEREKAEINVIVESYYQQVLIKSIEFCEIAEERMSDSMNSSKRTFADGWYKCKKHYGIQ